MKARYALYILLAAALSFALVSCGKKETTENAPATSTAPAEVPVDMSTAGSVSGTVKLDCAAQHATPATDQDVVAGSGGALGNVVVYVKDGLGNRTFATPKGAITIDQKG